MTQSPEDHELQRIQAWMQAVITNPAGIVQGIGSGEAQSQISVPAESVEQIVTRSSKQSAIERLGVYGNAYFARLLGCMQEDFPATRHAVGDDAFAGFVVAYLQKYPSTSYSLGELHRRFPTFLAESRPVAQTFLSVQEDEANSNSDSQESLSRQASPNWIDFVIDLATLESTYCDVFDGPGEEQLSLLTPESLTQLSPDQWMNARLQTATSLKLFHFRFPVQLYASAVRKQEPPTVPPARDTWLAIHRRDYIVRRRPLTLRQYRLLGALQRGLTVSAAIAESLAGMSAAADSLDANALASLSQQLQTDFREWVIEGYFRGIA